MTEAEWLACGDPRQLLAFLRGKVSDRRARLCLCACCKADRKEPGQNETGSTLELAERWADGDPPDIYERTDAWNATWPVLDHALEGRDYDTASRMLATSFCLHPDPLGPFASKRCPSNAVTWVPRIHCVFGNPFRPVAFSPSWRTNTAMTLARQMYDARDFGAMPILADALQDAGCDVAAVLDHCRGPGPHVRGCWVVDLVLGRA